MLREVLGKHNYKQKWAEQGHFSNLFLKEFYTPGGSFSVLISNVFGAGRYYLVVWNLNPQRFVAKAHFSFSVTSLSITDNVLRLFTVNNNNLNMNFWKIDILTVFLCDFLVSEWIKIKLNKDSLTLNDIWCEMKYHKKL